MKTFKQEGDANEFLNKAEIVANKWKPPPENFYNVNVDANSVGVGIIVRDHVGSFMAGKAMVLLPSSNVKMATLKVMQRMFSPTQKVVGRILDSIDPILSDKFFFCILVFTFW